MTDSEKLEDFSTLEPDVAPSAQECHNEKRSRDDGSGSVELDSGVQEFPTSEGDCDGPVAPPRDQWSNVELEPSLESPVRAQTRLPSFAQSEFYTVSEFFWHICACMS
jgi:hypothetical protein